MEKQIDFNGEIYCYRKILTEKAFAYTRDGDVAEDLVQETFIKAFRFAGRLRGESNLRAWLFTILRNTFLNHYHREKNKSAVSLDDSFDSVQTQMPNGVQNHGKGKFLLEDINRALSLIPEQSSYCFRRHFEGYKYEEIAQELNIPIGTVKTRIFVARELLKKMLHMHRE